MNMNTVKNILDQDIVNVLENAVNYGPPWTTLYIAALQEITELRKQVLELGGTLPKLTSPMTGNTNAQKVTYKLPQEN
jgi:K+-sensing histidine kinase KdpD